MYISLVTLKHLHCQTAVRTKQQNFVLKPKMCENISLYSLNVITVEKPQLLDGGHWHRMVATVSCPVTCLSSLIQSIRDRC